MCVRAPTYRWYGSYPGPGWVGYRPGWATSGERLVLEHVAGRGSVEVLVVLPEPDRLRLLGVLHPQQVDHVLDAERVVEKAQTEEARDEVVELPVQLDEGRAGPVPSVHPLPVAGTSRGVGVGG